MSMAVLDSGMASVPELSFNAPGFTEEPEANELEMDLAGVAKGIYRRLETMGTRLIGCTTVEEFLVLREKQFPMFVNLARALANIALSTVDQDVYARLVQESLKATELHFRSVGAEYLGDEALREVLFSVSTLRSAQQLVPRLFVTSPATPEKVTEDREYARRYFGTSVWTNIHLFSLKLAIDTERTINKDVLNEILKGLRGALMAYTYARAALELRGTLDARYQNPSQTLPWDSEDESLANSR